jgi:hypothetical protein
MKSGLGQLASARCLIGGLDRHWSAWGVAAGVPAPVAANVGLGLGLALGAGFVMLGLLLMVVVLRRSERWRVEAEDLRQRQARSAALGRLLDVWQWQTDTQHQS